MRTRALIAAVLTFALLAGCGGGGGGGRSSIPAGGGGTPAPAATTIGTTPTSVSLGTSGSMSITTTSGSSTANVSTSLATPIGSGVQSVKPQSATAILYVTLTATSNVTIDFPTFTSSSASGVAYAASSSSSWNYLDYVGNGASPQVFTASGTISLVANTPVYFALYTGVPSGGDSNLAYLCPTSDSTTAIRTGGATTEARRMTRRGKINAQTSSNLVAVVYDRATYQRSTESFTRSEASTGGTVTQTHDYPKINKVVHVLSVPAANAASVMATLKAQPGVLTVGLTGQRRYTTTVSNNNVVWSNANDPYFNGFQSPLPAPTANATAPPATYHVLPYAELDSVPGQWDMHAIGIEKAFSYTSAASNTGGKSNASAIGSSSIHIAIIDTGADTGLAELSGKVTRQRCFISDPNNVQNTSTFVTDPDGHGTDVSGIAAADINNGLGFAGAGGDTSLLEYRVFPTPDNSCMGNSPDFTCGASTTDIASAIDDAVNNGSPLANIISMSLGGGGCNAGVDTDPTEQAAVSNALANNVIVVAASGNEGFAAPDAPGCITGVISVGATSLDDGATNGTGPFGGSLGTPIEYVASYSNGGPTLSAPGGDPNGNTDNDDLHWIENIWTSTPFAASDAGNCNGDYPTDTGPGDCRILIAGTSMATPHVAGVAALILAVSGGTYATPSSMATYLCATSDNLNSQVGASGSPGTNQGCGRINAYRAVGRAVGDTVP